MDVLPYMDSHCHLDCPEFDEDRDTIVQHCKQLGMRAIVLPGIDCASWPRLQALAQSDEIFYASFGLHPYYVEQHEQAHLQELEQRISDFPAVAIGEIGLDFYIAEPNKEKQHYFFAEQLKLANQFELPVILHLRKSHDLGISLLKKYGVKKGVVHAYSGSEEQARQFIKLGFKLGFGGSMTYDRAKKIRRLASVLPLDAIVLETDAPDISPQPYHGQRNSPEYLPLIAQTLAELRQLSVADVVKATSENARYVFNI